MAKPRKNEQMDETKRIMERLVKMPHKLHEASKIGKVIKPSPKTEERPIGKPGRSSSGS